MAVKRYRTKSGVRASHIAAIRYV